MVVVKGTTYKPPHRLIRARAAPLSMVETTKPKGPKIHPTFLGVLGRWNAYKRTLRVTETRWMLDTDEARSDLVTCRMSLYATAHIVLAWSRKIQAHVDACRYADLETWRNTIPSVPRGSVYDWSDD